MLRVIERSPTHVIQKVTKPNGLVTGYQTVPNACAGDSNAVKRHRSLTDARREAGVSYKPPVVLTAPKSECPHNQPGYRAGGTKSKTKH